MPFPLSFGNIKFCPVLISDNYFYFPKITGCWIEQDDLDVKVCDLSPTTILEPCR